MLLPRDYVRQVQRAGGRAVLLAPDPVDTAAPDALLDTLDGLLLAGGVDVGDDPERDAFEIALTLAAHARDLPVLGICRGMQLMNVAHGGTLVEDLPGHRDIPGGWGEHAVSLSGMTAFAAGTTEVTIRSHHHQAVDRMAANFVLSGTAVDDNLPEAMEDPNRSFSLGVQWHPEPDPEDTIIAAFVDACR